MAWIFSKRCRDSLRLGKLKVSIPKIVRQRILMLMRDCNCSISVSDPVSGWQDNTDVLAELLQKLQTEHGKEMKAFPDEDSRVSAPTDLESFILRGNYPPYFFDALELFYEAIYDQPKIEFQKRLNEIMEESDLSWRMAEGKIFPVDSQYIEETILRRSHELLKEAGFEGALSEFENARADLANADYKGAIQNANLAVESICKGILGVKKIKPGELYRKLIDSGLVPEYYEGFLKAFEENILRCVPIMRNEELGTGHGQGVQVNEVPPELAELGLHLAAVIIHYLVKKHIAISSSQKRSESEIVVDDLPF